MLKWRKTTPTEKRGLKNILVLMGNSALKQSRTRKDTQAGEPARPDLCGGTETKPQDHMTGEREGGKGSEGNSR